MAEPTIYYGRDIRAALAKKAEKQAEAEKSAAEKAASEKAAQSAATPPKKG